FSVSSTTTTSLTKRSRASSTQHQFQSGCDHTMTNRIIQFRQGMPAAEDVELLDATISGYQAYRILSAALELGLFDWLSEHGPATRHDVAALGINGMFTRGFLAALADMGYITFDGGVC